MNTNDISDDILIYFSDKLQLDETPAGARKRKVLQEKIIQFAKDRKIEIECGTLSSDLEDQAYPDFYLDNEWFDHKHL